MQGVGLPTPSTKSGFSCLRPKLPVGSMSWWNKQADSRGICCHHPIQLKFLKELVPTAQGKELGVEL